MGDLRIQDLGEWQDQQSSPGRSHHRHQPPPVRANVRPTCQLVVARLDRAIQYAAASRFHLAFSGILDRPPEPVIRPAEGRTGWRATTAGGWRACAPKTRLRILAARIASEVCETITLKMKEGAGKTGCSARTRSSLRPLFFEGQFSCMIRARRVAGMRSCVSSTSARHPTAVMPRFRRGIQYSRESAT